MILRTVTTSSTVLALGLLAACGSMLTTAPVYSQAALPAAVQVPAGNTVALETVGVGEIS